MNKKNILKSGIAVTSLVVASMFGFSAALGYGGSAAAPAACSNVTYGEWKACADGMQFRDVVAQTPFYCQMTASQQLARSRSCSVENGNGQQNGNGNGNGNGQEVLGEKKYSVGTLLRGSDNKVYIVVSGGIKHIATLGELNKYAGREILDVSDDVISSFNIVKVLGEKRYGEGQLIRNDDVKVFVIVNGKKKHILNLEELAKYYFGKPIYHVTAEELATY